MKTTQPNEFLVTLKRVIDGDTIVVDMPIGFGLCLYEVRIRLHGVNAPEIFGHETMKGLISKQYLINLLKNKQLKVVVFTREFDKYGRVLGTLFAAVSSTDWLDVNEEMIRLGYATKANYVNGKYISDKKQGNYIAPK